MKYSKADWDIINKNTKHTAQLGFAVGKDAFWINTQKKSGGTRYKKCDFSKYKPFFIQDPIFGKIRNPEYRPVTTLTDLLRSHFGKPPVFEAFRIPKKPSLNKWKNVIAPIEHPNLYVYDFDNHNKSVGLSKKIKEIYTRLSFYNDLLIGYSPDFCGLHVFCITPLKTVVEKECEYFKEAGGHIDTFNSEKDTGIGIPGFDHYLYKEKDIEHFKRLLDVRFEKRISIYQNVCDQGIIYPKPIEIPKSVQDTINLYKNVRANTYLHLQGLRNCRLEYKKQQSSNDKECIQCIMNAEGERTHFLCSSQGHRCMIKVLSNLNIRDIDTFRHMFPDFEDNHYKLIEGMIEHIKDHYNEAYYARRTKMNENDYAKQVKDIKAFLKQLFHSNHVSYDESLLAVATYLVNCIKLGVKNPGFIHYIEYCKMNDEKPVPERTYYKKVTICKKNKLVSIPNNEVYTVGKKCREILKGYLLKRVDFQNNVKETSKEFNYVKVNNEIDNINSNNNKNNNNSSFSIILCAARSVSRKFTDVYRLNNFDTLIL